MSEVDSNHIHSQNLTTNTQQKINQHNQATQNQNNIVYVNSSDQFQNMEISRSQQFSKSFNDLDDNQLQNQPVNSQLKSNQSTTLHQQNRQENQKKQQLLNISQVNQEQKQQTHNQQNITQKEQKQNIQLKQLQLQLKEPQNTIINTSDNKQINRPEQMKQQTSQSPNLPDSEVTQNQEPKINTVNPSMFQQTTEQVEVSNIQQSTQPQIVSQSISEPTQNVDYEGLVSLHIFEKKINQAIQCKNTGNQHYKTNKYEDAIKSYSQGLRILDPKDFYGATKAECQKLAQVSASLLFNIAMCFYNMNIWRSAQIYFTQTITINPNHIKALYRRALCRYQIQNYQGAMNDIKAAFSKDRSNAQIHKSYQKILQRYNEQLKKQKESMKQISSKIFRKDSQKSLNESNKKQSEVGKEDQKVQRHIDSDQPQSDLWGFAPLILVAGAALYLGYKKWFSH